MSSDFVVQVENVVGQLPPSIDVMAEFLARVSGRVERLHEEGTEHLKSGPTRGFEYCFFPKIGSCSNTRIQVDK